MSPFAGIDNPQDRGVRPMSMKPQFELRQASDKKTWTLTGYASETGVVYKVNDHRGTYTEVIQPGAFKGTLAAGPDVVLSTEHQPPFVARTPRTLRLTEDDRGLKVDASLDDADPDVRALVSKVKAGILSQMSMAFRCDDNFAGTGTRSIRALSLDGGDVSICRTGANRATEVSVRGQAPGTFEVRSSGLIALRQDPALTPYDDEGERSAKRSGAPSVAELERRAAVARSRAAEARFEQAYGDRLTEIEGQYVTHYGRLASEALARGDAKAAASWVRAEIFEMERLAAGL